VRPTFLAAAVALALAAPARADEGDLRFRLTLHGRWTDRENRPQPAVLYDSAARAFELGAYLRTQGSDRYASTLASAGVEGRHAWFRWALAADTGELRSQSFPRVADVCLARLPATSGGLDEPGSGNCALNAQGRRTIFQLEETRHAASQVTSNGRPFADEVNNTLLLREAWAGAAFGRNDFALVRVGRKRFTVADGFVYDDYGTGVDARFDLGALGPSWDIGASLFYPTRDFPRRAGVTSAMLALRADYLPSLFEHAGLFVALYHDETGSVGELFRGSLAESSVVQLRGAVPGTPAFKLEEQALARRLGSAIESDANLVWLGTSGAVSLRRAKLDWTGSLGLGRATILLADARQSSGPIFGQLAHLRLRSHLTRELEVGGFFLFLSGDLPPIEKASQGLPQRYGGFLGVAPFVTDTNIFFNGGVSESFAARQATAPGVNGRGVLAPGLTASWDPHRSLAFDARAAYLVAPVVGPFGGRVYGAEVDLELSWSPLSWLTLVAEGDALFPGDFFAGRAPVTKVVLGIDLVAM
jgi:hypothetical protein